ncbi:hypothetical protein BH11ARM1_BH11ARM1_13380 [soil metagenome]
MSQFRLHSLISLSLTSVCATLLLYSCSGAKSNADPEPKVAKKVESVPVVKKPEQPKFERPKDVKGIYVTAWVAGGTKKLGQLIDFVKKTELNSMVIDIRDDGEMYWDTNIPLAKAAGAERHAVRNAKPLMDKLRAAGIYPIARIACYRDHYVPKVMPDRAVQVAGGKVWKDRSGHTWLDPYNKKNWEYLAQTVDFAMDAGFPEIQLDYVRFPSEGKAGNQIFPAKSAYPDKKATPSDVITEFAKYVGDRVRKRNVAYGADIFGIISSTKTDQGIGQTLEEIAEPFDVICPMVYPSHFAKGEYGIKDPNSSPYAIVKKSLTDYKERVPKKTVRPWLQDFSLGVTYGPVQVAAQIKAARELGYNEYLLWNAGNKYSPMPPEKAKVASSSGASQTAGAKTEK